MAGNDIINPVDVNNPSNTRRSSDLLPTYHRTDKNIKFLASTLDQYIQPPKLERLDGFLGSKLSADFDPTKDVYIDQGTSLRDTYRLEPSMIIRDTNGDVNQASTFDDLINQLMSSGANVSNLDRLFRPKSFSYDPCIDWDKFVNFREYYWVPTGPDSIEVAGPIQDTVSTYTVTDSEDGLSLLFTPPGITGSPLLTLYRGMTYVFNVTSQYPFYIKTAYVTGAQSLYSGASNQGTKNGQVILTVDAFTPAVLYYFAEGNNNAVGQIVVKALEEDTLLNVETDIVGKKEYTSGNGITLSNGMKIHFSGSVTPPSYLGNDYIVEGVGKAIVLVNYNDLQNSGEITTVLDVNFDALPFDQYPFDDFTFVPLIPEYVTINRASPDLNPWSRYNRWVHQDVITATANANGVPAVFDASLRAQRPIIEFAAGLQLYNFGATAKRNVDLIDTITQSAFTSFEGSPGFYIDGILAEQGFRVIFAADTDPAVNGKVFEVRYVVINNRNQISLVQVEDSDPILGQAVVVTRGANYAGTNWWYNGTIWIEGQQKTKLNQAPLFDLFDSHGNRYSDNTIYNGSFKGTQVFGYAIGTGENDSILGFPLAYKNVANVGDYLFNNYFMTDTFYLSQTGSISLTTVAGNYLRINNSLGPVLRDVWIPTVDRPIPVIQFQVVEADTSYIQINSFDNPGYISDLTVDVFVNHKKQMSGTDYQFLTEQERAYIVTTSTFTTNDIVEIKLFTSASPNQNGYYEAPINLTNNPLNGPVSNFTFTELSDHVQTIANNNTDFVGVFPGTGNLRDLSDTGSYATRIVSHQNPLSFAHYFLGNQEHNIIEQIRTVSVDYNQFKSSLIRQITSIAGVYPPAEMLDRALLALNANKDNTFPYGYSDMLGYGKSYSSVLFTVVNPNNTSFSLQSTFNSTILSERAILIYYNGSLLTKDIDYTIDANNPGVILDITLAKGDTVEIRDYSSTVGSYVPPTPTKLGLYPKFVPSIYIDNTYSTGPQTVIQGHDGNIMIAFGDYRDNVILEFEKRIYNNLKVNYNPALIDINNILPGAFKTNLYSRSEITNIVVPDFLKWSGFFGVDFQTNTIYDQTDPFTYNYSGNIDSIFNLPLPGYWRGIYKYFYGTDRPHTHPWEMIGFTEEPSWWTSTYGPAPYTNGNLILWQDLEEGRIANGTTAGVNTLYARPGLSNIIPVNSSGELLDPISSGLVATSITDPNNSANIIVLRSALSTAPWNFGDGAPAETAWYRSSYWPFACQVMLALTQPATYAATMFDPSRLALNAAGQYRYGSKDEFLIPANMKLFRDTTSGTRILAAGYSTLSIETGIKQDSTYLLGSTGTGTVDGLKYDLSNMIYNLMAKLGGFVSKDELQVGIDAVDPTSPFPGVLIPSEDYKLFFNQSSPVQSISISGMIIQKTSTGFAVRGYDKFNPYFTIYQPNVVSSDQVETVGGVSATYSNWKPNTAYITGQIVFYLDRYYTVLRNHNSDISFVPAYYQSLPKLPIVGGIGVIRRSSFSKSETIIPYGTEYLNAQDVYDLIVGYGRWLTAQGFVFDDFNQTLGQVLDWNFTAKEFLYWVTQNWAVNSVITLSPFANKLQFTHDQGVVEDIVSNFTNYSLLKADGAPFSMQSFTIVRLNGTFALSTVNTNDGLFFARLNVIQKEQAIVFNNYTIFNDVVYDIGSGYRQRRIQLRGFRTANWNGDFFSPGFIFDQAKINDWEQFTDYGIGDVVRFSGKYYSAPKSITGTPSFDFTQWILLNNAPISQLLPNFEYKINQFEDFYSLDIDNFDSGQQAAAQHLIGYTPRSYLNEIIGDPIAQYKFYQGYIRERGTKNPLLKLAKSSLNSFQSNIDFTEEWAFRNGYFGGYNTYQELETSLEPMNFIENPQIIEFVEAKPVASNDAIYYKDASDVVISPDNFDINLVFDTISTSTDEIFQLPFAGYPRFDDITATAYNKNSILDIANNSVLKEGSVIWVGFKENGDWDVLRYTLVPGSIVDVEIYVPGESLLVTTLQSTRIAVNDLISIVGVGAGIDQCYVVSQVISPNEFVVYSSLLEIPQSITLPITAPLYIFESARLPSLTNLYTIPYLERWVAGQTLWVDDDSTGNWVVYQKNGNNYNSSSVANDTTSTSENFGYQVDAENGIIAISSPYYRNITNTYTGLVSVWTRSGTNLPTKILTYSLNDTGTYYVGTGTTLFGSSLVLDTAHNIVIAGAPSTPSVHSTASQFTVSTSTTGNTKVGQGVVKISKYDLSNAVESVRVVITTPYATTNSNFGTSIAFASSTTSKLLVGSPGDNHGRGTVHRFSVTTSLAVTYVSSSTVSVTSASFGSAMSGNNDLTRIAISAPGYVSTLSTTYGSSGAVYIYTMTSTLTNVQVITGDNSDLPRLFGQLDVFGSTVKMTNDGQYLFIGSPAAFDVTRNARTGIVDIFSWNSTSYVHSQRLVSPITSNDTTFGHDIDIDSDNNVLIISSIGNGMVGAPTFDFYSQRENTSTSIATYGTIYVNDPASPANPVQTTFDGGATRFFSGITDAGSVHSYYKHGTNWAYLQEIEDNSVASGSAFGQNIHISSGTIYVGAPATLDEYLLGDGQIYIFDPIDSSNNGWNTHRNQDPLVDLSLIGRAMTINVESDKVQDYIDIIDPIKGRFLGSADEELKYTTPYDPAIYSLGISGVNVNSNLSWLDEHIGELWWDLSTVKYVWYEQGELEYRKNNWNNIFPGSSIDVYEWVRSEFLPSEWSQLADTTDGLTNGISGQPKFPDNSVISVKQVYNNVSNAFTNVYYYWVKNKNVLPVHAKNRRTPAYQVAQQIANPVGSGETFLAILSPTAFMLSNVKPTLGTEEINLNISSNLISDAANRHTEWMLLQENDPESKPNWLLEKKMIDSLLGYDSLGNPVPDPSLPPRTAYGIEVRPRQSMFVNRFDALRNIIEFSNEILATHLITGIASFANLNAKDKIPSTSTFDLMVEDIYALELIPTNLLQTAALTAVVNSDGFVVDVIITNPGYGYVTPPIVTISGPGTGAEIDLILDVHGRVVGFNITSAGTGYSTTPALAVRPFTAVIESDLTIGGKWSVNTWDPIQQVWSKVRTQNFDTTLYWNYIDWASPDYDQLQTIVTTIPSVYELEVLQTLEEGKYVKVLNGGDGRYIILRKTNGTGGSFDNSWDLVYSQNGTIRFSDVLWNQQATLYGWDQTFGFDQTKYDQAPDTEISYILLALQNDLFIHEMKIYWNKLFFKAVRYAMSEQKSLDWAFKTTFINVKNNLGGLTQPSTYKLQDGRKYEQFLEEIKPYHTKIRKITEAYTATDLTRSFTTDFDLPVYYNTTTLNFNKVEFGNPMLLQYPWRSWFDNYTYQIESIDLYDGGSGYIEPPVVSIIPAAGDNGTGATAVAYISLGKVSRVDVVNSGTNFAAKPTVVFNGGGGPNFVAAKAYARLGNSPVRINNITIKFDRVSGNTEIGNQQFVDTFTGDGEKDVFDLTWVPVPEKSLITLTINGVMKLVDDYTIVYSEQEYSPQTNTSYVKKYAALHLSFIPKIDDVIQITYPKDVELYTAADRIRDYYSPTTGMPGNDPAQLMTGITYPGLTIDTLPFNASSGWDILPFDSTLWDNYAQGTGYVSFASTLTTTQTFTLTNTVITTGTEVNVYINGVRIDGTSSYVPTLIGVGTAAVDYVNVEISGSGYTSGQTTVVLSAPDTINGVQAYATVTVVSGEISDISILPGQNGSGYINPPIVTVLGTSTVAAYASSVLMAQFTTTNTTTLQTSLAIPAAAFTSTSTLVVFRYSTDDGTLQSSGNNIDSTINAGDMAYTTALGLTPSEIILDGGSTSTRLITGMNDDGFLNTINSYAPEECVPGQIQEAIGISVYTQPQYSYPVIVNKRYYVDGSTSTYRLGIEPSNTSSVIVVFNDTEIAPGRYTIDFANNKVGFTSTVTGWLSLTSMQLGSVSLIGYFRETATSTGTVFRSGGSYEDLTNNVISDYVTINGIPVTQGSAFTVTNYLTRAQYTFNQTGTIQTYLFDGPVKSFSEISEQIVVASTTTSTFALTSPPGTFGPFHSQVIVTKNSARLNPPVTTYYEVENTQTTYAVSQSIIFQNGFVDLLAVEVYVNGTQLLPAGNWSLNQAVNEIDFLPNVISNGDVIAIVVKKYHDYLIENNNLVLLVPSNTNDVYHITTFTNHDPDFIRTERFNGDPTNRYRMQRGILDTAYVWVSYNGVPLTSEIDYSVNPDSYVVTVREGIFQNINDDVIITSFAGSQEISTGYRIFKDILGRTFYKRLSDSNTTELAATLYTTSTSITVLDGSVLTPPSTALKIPGTILIQGERIEFFTQVGNTLGQLRRGVLGTMPADSYEIGIPVIDQGINQSIPFNELTQSTSTLITTSTQTTFNLAGIINFNSSTSYTDQATVVYGGRVLLKPGLSTVTHDFNGSYDSTSTTDTVVLPEFTITSTSSVLTLNFIPQAGILLQISVSNSHVFDAPVMNFLQERSATLPYKYRYE